LRNFVSSAKEKNKELLKNYSFTHGKFIVINSTHTTKYVQIQSHTIYNLEIYIRENIEELDRKQKKFNDLWSRKIKEIDSEDEEI
jgi:hypothetical protein